MERIDDLRTEEEVRAYFERLLPAVEAATGLTHWWSGRVEIAEDLIVGVPRYRAKFGFSGDLTIQAMFLGTDELRLALLHEALHAVSAGVTPSAYDSYPGFEEGIVELAARVVAPSVLGEIEARTYLRRTTGLHGNLAALEELRSRTALDESAFYLGLLRTPLSQRLGRVVEWVQDARPETSRSDAPAVVAQIAARLSVKR